MIAGGEHREEPGRVLRAKLVARGKPPSRFVGAKLDRHFSVNAVGAADDTDHHLDGVSHLSSSLHLRASRVPYPSHLVMPSQEGTLTSPRIARLRSGRPLGASTPLATTAI